MQFQNALLWNVEELLVQKECEGYQLLRVPEKVRRQLSDRGQRGIGFASNMEIRFCMDPGETEVKLILGRMPVSGGVLPEGILEVFQGDYQAGSKIAPLILRPGQTEIVIRKGDLSHLKAFAEEGSVFAPEVTRVLLPYNWGCTITAIRGKIQPPTAAQLPVKRLLVYGSSISHGGNAQLSSRTYAFRLAQELKADLLNLGCAGSAYMDPAMASYIAGRRDWDAALLELGVNVIGKWTASELETKAEAFIRTIKEQQPQKPVFVTDMVYNWHDCEHDPDAASFRTAIAECVEKLQKKFDRLYYKNGLEIMNDRLGVSSDGLHPSDYGHEKIAAGMLGWIRGIEAE